MNLHSLPIHLLLFWAIDTNILNIYKYNAYTHVYKTTHNIIIKIKLHSSNLPHPTHTLRRSLFFFVVHSHTHTNCTDVSHKHGWRMWPWKWALPWRGFWRRPGWRRARPGWCGPCDPDSIARTDRSLCTRHHYDLTLTASDIQKPTFHFCSIYIVK